ncbi:MAG TPA: AsmA-like C-terminal region-containing protein, partial [Bacteroidales bacterium]|nr:AsmA-like C-terminal region-containing protein [Bacteroidales bacterium]
SNTTNVTQLMNLTSGIGYEKENIEDIPDDTTNSGPYMVPKGIDIKLNTRVQNASFGVDSATNITGNVHVYDGILLLDKVRLRTHAARMQLTAMYRTPRKNHLFMGLDYHMLDVEISELLDMIPEVDTLMPMLRSFGGEGEFHLAIETYLDSTYNLKMSTLRGAASVAGQDLVLMDGETFSEIAKKLRFSKQAENRVDSLSAEFTVFRNEVDVYPFLIVMDRYKAIVAGRHNFDMSFDYHISLIDSPVPVKLGVDVTGTLEDMSIRPVRPRYAETYRPAARFAVANKQLELRELIRKALTVKIDW